MSRSHSASGTPRSVKFGQYTSGSVTPDSAAEDSFLVPDDIYSAIRQSADRDVSSVDDQSVEFLVSYRTTRVGDDMKEAVDDMKSPNSGPFQAFLDFGLTLLSSAWEVAVHWAKKLYHILFYRRYRIRYCSKMLKSAAKYDQWEQAALELDSLLGNDRWKADPISTDYDAELIHGRLAQLKAAREMHDYGAMIFLLRTSLSRNLGGIGSPNLYAQSVIGTKQLIEDYTREVVLQLNMICDSSDADFMSLKSKIEFFKNTRHSYGNTALLLSGGGSRGMNHVGVIKCLHEQKLLPRIISGSSAGAIVASLVCTRKDEDFPIILDPRNIRTNALDEPFDENGGNTYLHHMFRKLRRFIQHGVIFDGKVLQDVMRDHLGDITFLEAYNRTRRILNVTVSSSTIYEMPRLLNYLTSPNVVIWSAVAASCSVPTVFKSMPLIAKDGAGRLVPWNPSNDTWIDGSVENDLPKHRLSELFNCNHFLVSQVNPHVVPFMKRTLKYSFFDKIVHRLLFLISSELQYRINQLIDIGLMPRDLHRIRSVLSQQYYGDITIVPEPTIKEYLTMLSSPTTQYVEECILRGERATWPMLSILRGHCQIEIALDQILYRLRCQLLDTTHSPMSVSELEQEDQLELDPPVSDETVRDVQKQLANNRTSAPHVGKSRNQPASSSHPSFGALKRGA